MHVDIERQRCPLVLGHGFQMATANIFILLCVCFYDILLLVYDEKALFMASMTQLMKCSYTRSLRPGRFQDRSDVFEC